MHFLFFIRRHNIYIYIYINRALCDSWAQESVKPTGQALIKRKFGGKSFQYKNTLGLCYTLLKYIMVEIPPTEWHTSEKECFLSYSWDYHGWLCCILFCDWSKVSTNHNLTSLYWLSQCDRTVSIACIHENQMYLFGQVSPMPPYSKKKQFTRLNSVKIIINVGEWGGELRDSRLEVRMKNHMSEVAIT